MAHIYFPGGKNLEVSTFRDVAEAPEVSDDSETATPTGPIARDNVYGTESTDALRRDITINGLFLDVSTMEIRDYVGGIKDLREGLVRVIGDPTARFREDPVRMLRVVRHAARNGFLIDQECWRAIVENAEYITHSSQVRVFDELKKDMCSGSFLTILSLLGETGLLQHLLPELLENNGRLLSAVSDLSQSLEKIDDLVVQGEVVSASVPLTIIAMFTAGDSIWLRDLAESLPQADDLHERLAHCLTCLTVPRKEREKIQILLANWTKVRSLPLDSFRPGAWKRSAILPELVTMLEVTPISKDDLQKLNLLRPLLHNQPEIDDSRRLRDHRKRPNRRPYSGGEQL